MSNTRIELADAKTAFAFQPVIQVSLTAPQDPILLVAVQFVTLKDGQQIHVMQKSAKLDATMLFKADDVADLAPYKRGYRMVGTWQFNAGISIFKADILKNSSGQEALQAFLASSRYQGISSFEIEVVRATSTDDLNPDGTMRNVARVQEHADVTVNMNEI